MTLFSQTCGGETEQEGPECGNVLCAPTEYCADPHCGICLPPGSVLIHHEFESCTCGGVECPTPPDSKSNSCCLPDNSCGFTSSDGGCVPIDDLPDGSSSG
ncbi:MAG: hypothetical protein HYZ29_17220 [Myxococcales bacterium]|nr:hypothetical protein [Myxococcales bacterium]